MTDSRKVALVTGSTSGIGLAIAHALAKRGVNIVITGFGDEATITNIKDEIRTRYGVCVDYVAGDLRKLSDIELLWSSALQLHPDGIDILINNAGLTHADAPVEDLPDDLWEDSIAVMLTAPFHLIKRCLPSMKKKGYGRIVNIASSLGFTAQPNISAYIAAKHGIIGLTKGVALETAAHGITCNAICPGMVQTPLLEGRLQAVAAFGGVSVDEVRSQFLSQTSTGKFVSPQQVSELVEFVCLSNASSQMTGAAYLIDHGLTAQ